jgi:hypothetical protein
LTRTAAADPRQSNPQSVIRVGAAAAAAAPLPVPAPATIHADGHRQSNEIEKQQVQGEVDWEATISRACSREETDCAICLGPLAKKEGQGLALLSCSHVFHVTCVTAFESFAASRRDVPSCPVCRGAYARRCFEVHLEGVDM